MSNTKTTASWEFYYTNTSNPHNEIIVTTKTCKCPKRTGTWKVLETWFNRGDCESIGYRKV